VNEDQYYNPIIQAMVHTATLQKQGAQQEIEKKRNEQQNKIQEQGLAQAQQQIENAHEMQLKQHDIAEQTLAIHRKQADMEAELNRFHALKAAQEVLSGAKPGLDLNKVAPGLTQFLQGSGQQFQPQQSRQLPIELGGDQQQPMAQQQAPQADFSGLFDPEAKARQVGAVTKAEEEAKLPSLLKVKDAENNHKLQQLGVQKGYDESIARIHGDYQTANARINGAYHLEGIRLMHQLGLDDGSGSNASVAKSLLDGIYNGNQDYSKLTPDQKRAVTGYAQGTGELSSIPSDGKAYKAKLDSVSGIQTLISQYKELAADYSRDSKGAFDRGNQNVTLPLVGTLQRTAPGSDLESKIAAMKSSGGQLATFFDQQNRKSDAEIIRQVMGEFDPKATAKQNVDKLTTHLKQLQNAIKQNFVGMNPDRVKSILGERGIDSPEIYDAASAAGQYHEGQTATGPDGHKLIYHNGNWEEK